MIPTYLIPLANHLWQSTVFAGTVALLCLALRRNRASVRYWLWLAASVKFLVPLAWLTDLASRLGPAAAPADALPHISYMVRGATQPFALPAPAPLLASVPTAPSVIPAALFAIWFGGFGVSLFCWLRAWRRMRAMVRFATPIEAALSRDFERVRVMGSSLPVEPCVFGILRPVILLPNGIGAHLTNEQLEPLLLHELCHVRRRDNLTAAMHLMAEAVVWFYPPIYWIGRRLLSERETACDQEVLRVVAEPETYAEGILAVCKFAVQAAPISAGVAGPNLKRRIEAIVGRRAVLRLDFCRKLILTAALGAVIGAPFWTGVIFIRAGRAQAQGVAASVSPFAVASIKPNRSGERNSGFKRFVGGQLDARNVTLRMLISFAYDLPQERILQGPAWLDSEKYDVLAKPDGDAAQPADQSMGATRLRTQALLADRFQLALHKETKQLPVFRLLIEKDGPKNLHPSKSNPPDLFDNGHHVTCQAASMAFFAKNFLAGQVGGPVIDETGIQGNFDFSMDWTPADSSDSPTAADAAGPSLFSALREQLGLKLTAGKGPVEVVVVDRAEKALEN